jgi:hypothetical protein
MRSLRRSILSALFVPLLGCATEPTVSLPEGAQAFTAPADYTVWWSKTESCAELAGRMNRVEWYVVPGVSTFETDLGPKVGIRVKVGDRITIVLAGEYQHHEMVVRHEMLHAILDRPGHPALYFEERCRLTWATWIDPNADGTTVAENHEHDLS